MNEDELCAWCDNVAKNGISQHSDEWLTAKTLTVGGSSIAILDGSNTFTNLHNYIALKLGLATFNGDIKPRWGNLFEEVIKLEVEAQYNCKVYGEDLYVVGKHYGTSYSPDGLAIIDGVVKLLEFKCPYSRIPGKAPPSYYVPQVKMGLCLLDPPTSGLYIEAVYRRCSWTVLGPGPGFDKKLVPRPATGLPVSYGFIGFYTTPLIAASALIAIESGEIVFTADTVSSRCGIDEYEENDENITVTYDNPVGLPGYINEYRDYHRMNDLGISSPTLFKNLMLLMDKGFLKPWYGRVLKHKNVNHANSAINSDLRRYQKFCTETGAINYGVLPWKLLRIESHKIEREEGFLDPYIDPIKRIIDFVKETKALSVEEKTNALDRFIQDYYAANTVDILEYDDDVDA